MNTLHHSRWQSRTHLESHRPLLSDNDSLVLFGDWPDSALSMLNELLSGIQVTTYLVNGTSNPHIKAIAHVKTIEYADWLKLITKHKNTCAWK